MSGSLLDFSTGWFDRLMAKLAEWKCDECGVFLAPMEAHPVCEDCGAPVHLLGWDEPMEGDES